MTKSPESVIKKDVIVQFQSRVGNRIRHPSQWSVEDKGDTFFLRSPDQQAMISGYTCTIEGSGSLADFQELVLSSHSGDWEESQWADIEVGGIVAKKRYLTPRDEKADSAWWIYVLTDGDYYHALRINASQRVMELNGGFYEQIVQTFKGL